MTEACDPDADIESLRKMIKMQTGEDIKLTRKEMCDAYDNIHGGKLPFPPLVMSSDRTYLLDRISPLKPLDYELLFDSATKRNDLKRIARKVGLTSQVEQKTKKQLVDAIGKRLRYLKIREPVKIVSKRLIVKSARNSINNTAVNNTAVGNNTAVNNTAVNNNGNSKNGFNNNSAYNNTENRGSNFNNFGSNAKNGGSNNNFGGSNNNNRGSNNNFGGSNNNNRGSNNLSGNKPGLTFKNGSNNKSGSISFPNKLSFKPKFLSNNKSNNTQQAPTVPTGNMFAKKTPAFLTQPQNSAPAPAAAPFSGSVKKNASFLNKGASAPAAAPFSGGIKKNASFLNKGASAPAASPFSGGVKKNVVGGAVVAGAATAVAASTANKKPGMFNWMFKKKNAKTANGANKVNAGTGANNVNAGTGTNNGANNVNTGSGNKLVNALMGPNKVNTGSGTNNGANKVNTGTGTNNGANKVNAGTGTNNGANKVNTGSGNKLVNALMGPNKVNAGTGTNNGANKVNTKNGPNRDVAIVANKLLTEINKDVVKELRTNTTNRNVVNHVTNGIMNQLMKQDITNSINKPNLGIVVASNKNNVNVNTKNMNTETKNLFNSINKANTLTDLRKVFLKGSLKLHPNKGGDEASFKLFMNVHNKRKSKISKLSNVNSLANQLMKEINKDVVQEVGNKLTTNNNVKSNNNVNLNADIKFLADKIYNEISTDVKKQVKTGIRRGGRAAEPIYNNLSNSNNNKNENKNNNKKNPTMVNNPTFNSNNTNNFKNASNNAFKVNNGEISAESLTNSKVTNDIPEEVGRQENNVRNIIKNFNSERNTLKNKITKELNLIPNNNGVFQERKGLTKGRIGVWAQELRAAETSENLKGIGNKLNEKTSLRKNIENKYTKMGLTKVEKMNHRRKVVQFKNDVDARRKLIEIQVKNKKNNNSDSNNNTNSVVSNYNSNANANSNEPKKKMKYGSRENFINAKKVELRELAKNTSTNFGRNIDRMKNRTNVTKLRGRIEGAVRRDEALKKVNTRPRSERRVDNKAVLKNLKKKVKKNNPGFSPAKVNAEARRLRNLSKK